MPHDSKGRVIEAGDVIIAKHWLHGNKPAACLVIGVTEGTESCNVQASSVHAPLQQAGSFTAKEVEVVVKKDGTIPHGANLT
jgi:hypothetical protein